MMSWTFGGSGETPLPPEMLPSNYSALVEHCIWFCSAHVITFESPERQLYTICQLSLLLAENRVAVAA